MQPRRGLQCNPQCPHDSDDHPGRLALSQLQGRDSQRHAARPYAEFCVGEYVLRNVIQCFFQVFKK